MLPFPIRPREFTLSESSFSPRRSLARAALAAAAPGEGGGGEEKGGGDWVVGVAGREDEGWEEGGEREVWGVEG